MNTTEAEMQPTVKGRSRSIALPSLRTFRQRKGLTQRQLANRAKVTQGTISDLEVGQRGAYPSTIRRLAQALEIHVEELVGK